MSIFASTWAYEQSIKISARKFVLVALANFADEDGYCFPSQDTLANMTGQGVRSIRRHLTELEKTGFIKRRRRTDGKAKRLSDEYELLAPRERLVPYRTNDPVARTLPDNLSGRPDYLPDNLSGDPSVVDKRKNKRKNKRTPLPPKDKLSKVESSVSPPYNGPEFTQALEDFEACRRESKRPLKPTSRKLLYKKLAGWGESVATVALIQSAEGGWLGVYEPKQPARNGSNESNDRPIWMASEK